MEVCVETVQSAINAQAGGASQIELCANLMEGGTTPSIGLLKVVKSQVSIPVFVMIRPRGGDFYYSDLEIQVMKEDMKALKAAGADGFVFGVLTENGEVDTLACQSFLEIAHPCPATFHRAIDMSCDIFQSLKEIISLGFNRVLTSGGYNSALEGSDNLQKMVLQAEGTSTKIVPGGGIKADNLERVLVASQAKEFHGSARKVVGSLIKFKKPNVYMGSQPNIEYINKETCIDGVKQMVKLYESLLSKQ